MCAPAGAATSHVLLSSVREAPAGTALGEPGAVAVDHDSGEVFLAEPARGVVDVLDSSGAYVGQFGEGVLEAQSIAVDEATGDVYVSEAFADAILVFKPNGAGGYGLLSEWSGASTPTGAFGQVAGVAVENCRSCSWAGDVFVVDREVPGGERGAVDLFAPEARGSGRSRGRRLRGRPEGREAHRTQRRGDQRGHGAGLCRRQREGRDLLVQPLGRL